MSAASIFTEKKSNRLFISIMVKDDNGKRKRIKRSTGLIDTPKNRRFVETKMIPALERKNAAGELTVPKQSVTVKALGDEYLNDISLAHIRAYTIQKYTRILENHIYPEFGECTIETITSDDLHRWLLKKLSTLAEKTVKDIKIPFAKLFEKAVRQKIISGNPFSGVPKNIFKNKRREAVKITKEQIENNTDIDPFNESEIKQLLNATEGKFRNWIGISFFCALRPSELVYLEWEDVHLGERYLIVQGAITGKQTKEEELLTKTESSKRTVFLSNEAIKYFKSQYSLTGAKNSKVFLNKDNKPYSSSQSIRDHFWRDLFDMGKKRHSKFNLGIRYRSIYNLRHSWASINLSHNRLPLVFISKQMGHSDPSITLKAYSTFISSSESEVFSMLDKSTMPFKANKSIYSQS